MRAEEITNIPKEKFVLVNENKKLRDKELVTKPIGFFKDAMHRFAKNKGSIVGAIIIGLLILFAIVVPWFSQYTVSYNDTYYRYTLPKVFTSENVDFLDGGTNKTLNEASFIYYYGMGAETGHNAVKRQEYTKSSDGMYTFRLDTYQQVGVVFKNVTADEYEVIQRYQDEHDVQIIYPITDPSQRPEQRQDLNNANYWYKTKLNGSVTVPDEYVIHEDGTIEFTNIYAAYSIPVMEASTIKTSAALVELVAKDSGYAIAIVSKLKDENDNDVFSRSGYIKAYHHENNDYTEIVDSLEEASAFTYNASYHTMTIVINGHEHSADDGLYCFALNSTRGSEAELVNVSVLGSVNYTPFSFYQDDVLVDDVVTGQYYNYAVDRPSSSIEKYYSAACNNGLFSIARAETAAKSFEIEEIAGGYVIKAKNMKGVENYINVYPSGTKVATKFVNDLANASVYQFDASRKALKVAVTGFADASLDGDYYYTVNVNALSTLQLHLLSDVDNTNIYCASIADPSTYEAVSSLTSGEYVFDLVVEKTYNNFYYVNGAFKGDNYSSKMRIEGSGNLTYSYAIKKDGSNYEIRVNYYEYYVFYHQAILKDRITSPYFLFGTTANGQDIFTCLASGARFSFIMAIIVAAVNMVVGAIYGAIEGYYGGKVDLIMERIVEILSAVPFMIVITLLKYHMGGSSQALILFIAFFLTGWIGESGTVRMQFYRFKNQEYVLAARTLGASDKRIMFKHIFPNALGTIVTSSVLVIPGMIFSETSLSYLGIINLNSGSMTSVGTLLANAQPYLVTYPHMILFPAIFISLLMLCFNLFGNGLRDAFNPSLRGTED